MEHMQFKANQTAAIYVADGLDERELEHFELHMMSCAECTADVETWRAIKTHMPAERDVREPEVAPAVAASSSHRSAPSQMWRMAASVAAVGVLGAAGGWFGHSVSGPDLNSTDTAFFNVPAVTRGFDGCTTLQLAAGTRTVALRVPGVASDQRLIVTDAEGKQVAADVYAAHPQTDNSWLVRFNANALDKRAMHLTALGTDGSSEPIGCVTGLAAPTS